MKEDCVKYLPRYFVNGLPSRLEPHTMYIVQGSPNPLVYITDARGEAYLIGGGETPQVLHNSLPDLQGGTWHFLQSEHDYLQDVVQNDDIGSIYNYINQLATPPTYVPPTSSISNITATYEVGSQQGINIVQTFSQNNGGAKISETITKNNSVVTTASIFSENLTVPLGNTIYAGTVNYGQGACLSNNIGIEDCTGRIEAGTTISPSRTITGIYPVFSYKSSSPITASSMASAIEAGNTTKYVITSTGTFTVNYAPNAQYFAVAHPSSSTTKTKWKVTELSQGLIPGGVFGAPSTQNLDSPDGFWGNISYKIYVTPLITNPSAPTIQLLNS
jgi:hypothetical protein